jgi:hypothetical protein
MATHLFATTCAAAESLPWEPDWYCTQDQSLYAAIAKAANTGHLLPQQKVAKEIEWQSLCVPVEVDDLVNPEVWKISGNHYERCHDMLDVQRKHHPMHNGSQAIWSMGPLNWETLECCSGGSAPGGSASGGTGSGTLFLGGSAPEQKTVRWYSVKAVQKQCSAPIRSPGFAGAGRNPHSHNVLYSEKSTWFPSVTHAMAAGINEAAKLASFAPGGSFNMHLLEFPESKLVSLMQHNHIKRRSSRLETWELKFPLTQLWPRLIQHERESTETRFDTSGLSTPTSWAPAGDHSQDAPMKETLTSTTCSVPEGPEVHKEVEYKKSWLTVSHCNTRDLHPLARGMTVSTCQSGRTNSHRA